ncbi:Helicase C-terminal [Penicillium atrosanguineum]|uniref:Helicase C-terminal n=1 Tax=Penicillium atrosanguineum TaxID=1132637 RepID=UPI0023908763|nr:Helicase C-terminal [Penicillium atrosanguineum]KAJ5309465.1 Helicase C-terminal [Penicillium atrosanguineum]
MGPSSTSKWSPSNRAHRNYHNFHCGGIFLGLDSSLAGMRLPAKHAETISVQNQDLAPARSTWRIVSVTALEIGTGTTESGLIRLASLKGWKRKCPEGVVQRSERRAPFSASFKGVEQRVSRSGGSYPNWVTHMVTVSQVM